MHFDVCSAREVFRRSAFRRACFRVFAWVKADAALRDAIAGNGGNPIAAAVVLRLD
jgi:hypothetical protein